MKWLWYPALVVLTFGMAFANIEAFRAADPRLEEKVTIEANHLNLEEIVQSLAEQSGVDIKAGTGRRDWKVRERKLSIHAKEIPLGQMLDEIKRVTGFHLSREGKEGEWGYIVWQDLKGRHFEQEMLIASKEAQAQRAIEIRQSVLDTAAEVLDLTPEEALEMRDESPLAAYMGGAKAGRGFAQILLSLQSGFPTEYELMMRGKKVSIPVSALPPWLGGAVQNVVRGGFVSWIDPSDPFTQEFMSFIPHQLVIEAIDDSGPDFGDLLGIAGMMTMETRMGEPDDWSGPGMPAAFFPMTGPDSMLGNLFGDWLLDMEDGVGYEEATGQAIVRMEKEYAGLIARKSPTEEDPPTDPELVREIEILELFGDVSMWIQEHGFERDYTEDHGKMMGEIARAADISVLLESYATMVPISAFIEKGKQPFYHILIAVEKAGCTWELGNGTLRIRPESWAIYRTFDIPESFLNHYKALLEQNGEFTLDDIAEIAVGLTDPQIEGGLAFDQELGLVLSDMISSKAKRDILRAYALMDQEQRITLRTEDGLFFAHLTDQQWLHLEEVIIDHLSGVHISDGSIRIRSFDDEWSANTEAFELVARTDGIAARAHTIRIYIPTKAHIDETRLLYGRSEQTTEPDPE